MTDPQPVFRRLSDEEYDSFLPFVKWRGLKIFGVIILLSVLIKWIVRT